MNSKIKDGGKVALLGGLGGLLAAGVKMLAEPALFKDQTKITKFFWAVPAGEILVGAVGGAFPKTAIAAAGMAGAGVAHLVENANLAISIKKNAAASGGTSGYDAGALVTPQALMGQNVGALPSPRPDMSPRWTETGALVIGRAP